MDNEKISQLMISLRMLRYSGQYSTGGSYTREVIDKDNIDRVEQVIRQFLLDNHDDKLGQLEAKVFMYEQIIAKSNFAPMLAEHTQDGGQEG